jgi:transcriptional regulator with XRE-family HTH domain
MTPKQIKLGRVKMGLNQTKFAELMGVQRSAVVAWEHGNDIPQKKNMDKLEEVLMPHLWKDLTDDEVFALSVTMPIANRFEFARAISSKLKERNT